MSMRPTRTSPVPSRGTTVSLPTLAASRSSASARRPSPQTGRTGYDRSTSASARGGASMMTSRNSPASRSRMSPSRSGAPGASSTSRRYGGSASMRSGAGGSSNDRAAAERAMKRTAKKVRELFKVEARDRAQADQERTEFVNEISAQFDAERETMLSRTITRLNQEVATLKYNSNQSETNWRQKWKRVVTEAGKLNEMLAQEGVNSESSVLPLLAAAEDGRNAPEIAEKLAFFTKQGNERVQQLKRDKLNEKLRGDDLDMKLELRTRELAAADRLIRTHLVGRGSESTIAVELFRKQGLDFEKRFQALEHEFRNRVEQLLQDSASIEMVGVNNHEDAIIGKLRQNRELDGGEQQQQQQQQQALLLLQQQQQGNKTPMAVTRDSMHPDGPYDPNKRTLSQENARRVEDSRAWRPSGKNYVDILETFITSAECQKILQVQLLRDVQLAMLDLSKKHFNNITYEIRKNRSNLPASVRSKLFDDSKTTRDDLVELLDLLSFEPNVAEMIMGRFPPTELEDAAPELQRFMESHKAIHSPQQQQQQGVDGRLQNLASLPSSQQLAGGSGGSSPSAAGEERSRGGETGSTKMGSMSAASVDGGDARTAGVDLTSLSDKKSRRQLPVSGVPGQIGFPTAFGNTGNVKANPKRVQMPRKPFEIYLSRINKSRAGFSDPDGAESVVTSSSNVNTSPPSHSSIAPM